MEKFKHVFAPLTIRGKRLKNRMQYSPMVPNLVSAEGDVTPEFIAWIAAQARTGVAFITLGDTQIDHKTGACFLREVAVDDDKYLAGLYKVAEAAHRYGALLSIELSHTGAGANPSRITEQAYSPSGVALPAPFCARDLKIMDRADMDFIRDKWVDCATRCVKAGFDMVLVHSAHQNLLGQFLSPATNTRTDAYGGSLETQDQRGTCCKSKSQC